MVMESDIFFTMTSLASTIYFITITFFLEIIHKQREEALVLKIKAFLLNTSF